MTRSPESRRVISWATLAVTTVATLAMAVWGFNALTEPFEDDSTSVSSSGDDPTCAPGTGRRFLARGDVTVSVYNAGKKNGRAQDTLDLFEGAGFAAGAIGNAPEETEVVRAEVRTRKNDDPAAKLVALALGKNTEVTVTGDDLGPGIDVFIGDKFRKLAADAPRRVRLTEAACQ